jgi:hypothetical protein
MKIGLLAMSGLHAHDPKLLQLGLTLPGIIDCGKVIAKLPSLGLLFFPFSFPFFPFPLFFPEVAEAAVSLAARALAGRQARGLGGAPRSFGENRCSRTSKEVISPIGAWSCTPQAGDLERFGYRNGS